jgi:hypothetical protein
MLKYQMALIALLIGCVAFISCDIIQEILTPPMPEEDMMPTDESVYLLLKDTQSAGMHQ